MEALDKELKEGDLSAAVDAQRRELKSLEAELGKRQEAAIAAKRQRDDAIGARYVLKCRLEEEKTKASEKKLGHEAHLEKELKLATMDHHRLRAEADLVGAEIETLQKNLVDLKLDLAIASEKSEDIKDEIRAGRVYSQKLKDELMLRGLLPCTCTGPQTADTKQAFRSLLTRFRTMGNRAS